MADARLAVAIVLDRPRRREACGHDGLIKSSAIGAGGGIGTEVGRRKSTRTRYPRFGNSCKRCRPMKPVASVSASSIQSTVDFIQFASANSRNARSALGDSD